VAYAAYRNKMSLRCVISDADGNKITSNEAVLTYTLNVGIGPVISQQPQNAVVGTGELAYFSVKVSGKDLKYLWQYKLSGETNWVDWTTKTTAKISVAYAAYRNGMSLRCVITDGAGNTVTSNEAVLIYSDGTGPVIIEQPKSTTAVTGSLAFFSVKAAGNNLKYLWQYKLKGETVWVDWTTKTTAEISVAYASYRNGMSLRCVITDKDGNKVTSSEAVLKYVG